MSPEPGPTQRSIAMGVEALRAGNPQRAAALSADVLARRPRDGAAHWVHGAAMARMGRTQQAMHHLERAVELEPASPAFRNELGQVLRDEGQLDEALEQFTEAARLAPTMPDPAVEAASLCEQLNDLAQAEEWAGEAIARDPENPAARTLQTLVAYRRATSGGREPAQEDVSRWAERTREIIPKATDPLTACQAWSLLVDLEERRSDYDKAFAAMTEMNRALQRVMCYSADQRRAYLRTIAAMVEGLTPEMTSRWREQCPRGDVPIPVFLMGFPRSGTTMTERALDAHPGVCSLEERRTLRDVKRRIVEMLRVGPRVRPSPTILDALSQEQVGELRRVFWRTVEAERGGEPVPDGVLLLDKNPMRSIDLPFVNRVFPDAKVLFAIRDPRDVCLSCYRQRLRSTQLNGSFFVDLEETARLYEAVMTAWRSARDAYSFPWMQIRYEQTVADFPGAMRAMLEFLGLPWDDAVLEFHKTTRTTWTVNQWAIRDKVNTRAVGRWKHYESNLEPILDTLAPFIDEFGYAQ